MTEEIIRAALARWGLSGADVTLVAKRENQVFRVDADGGRFALRLHRAGLRSARELHSELLWMQMLASHGVTVPAPVPAPDGALDLATEAGFVDFLEWLDGASLRQLMDDGAEVGAHIADLGRLMARMHDLADSWQVPDGFDRHAWDCDGLAGEAPLWGRFWENPTLTEDQAKTLLAFRDFAGDALARRKDADFGLIHADLVPENVLVSGKTLQPIDFDDGGYGDRLFDLATVIGRCDRADPTGGLTHAFLEGYSNARVLDLSDLPLFRALRACTYVGWIVPRMSEEGSVTRNERFIREAMQRVYAAMPR